MHWQTQSSVVMPPWISKNLLHDLSDMRPGPWKLLWVYLCQLSIRQVLTVEYRLRQLLMQRNWERSSSGPKRPTRPPQEIWWDSRMRTDLSWKGHELERDSGITSTTYDNLPCSSDPCRSKHGLPPRPGKFPCHDFNCKRYPSSSHSRWGWYGVRAARYGSCAEWILEGGQWLGQS
jgi:hypothetical protein